MLQSTSGIVLLDKRIGLLEAGEVAVVLGRKSSQVAPLTANMTVPAGRYRAVVVLVPEE